MRPQRPDQEFLAGAVSADVHYHFNPTFKVKAIPGPLASDESDRNGIALGKAGTENEWVRPICLDHPVRVVRVAAAPALPLSLLGRADDVIE